jgi:hypothetical protein
LKLPQLPPDKANHFVYGAVIASLGAIHSVEAGAIACAAFAVLKEVYDRISKKGAPEVADVLATIAGGAVVLCWDLVPRLVAS